MPSRRVATAVALALLLGATPSSGAELIERILAVVDGRPLCLSDVRAVASLDGVDLHTALTRLVDETLVVQEAYRLPQASLSPDEKRAAAAAGETEGARRAAYRRAVIRKYVAFRFRPQVRIDDKAVRDAYEEERAGGSDAPPFENAEAALRERLAEREVQARVDDWTRDLRAAAAIRYNPPDPD